MNQLKINRIAKYIQWALEIAFVVVFVALCIAVGCKNKKLDGYRDVIQRQELVIERLTNDTIH